MAKLARLVMRLIQPPGVQVYPYDIAPDGRILALTPVSGVGTNITLTVLVDWQAGVAQITSMDHLRR